MIANPLRYHLSPELFRVPVRSVNPAEAAPAARQFDGPDSEYGLLKEVLLASPRNLSIVPCNRVSEDALENGQSSCSATASRQHRALIETLMQRACGCGRFSRSRAYPTLRSPAIPA
jgi:hypothetical protein